MGVEAFFYAYDEAWFAGRRFGPVTVDTLLAARVIAMDGSVAPAYAERIRALESVIGHNKQWNNNLAADMVYSRVRDGLAGSLRARADAEFALLFWDPGEEPVERPAGIAPPSYDHASSCRLYGAASVAWLAAPRFDPEELRPGFGPALAGWPPADRAALGLRNLDDPDTFIWWTGCWRDVFKAAADHWALLIYVWY
ncbi:MAG TPA: hypothetical protein VD886_12575 [Herpetosiphonaceae bacterium]|nr:hypothetical protein [Herpetosiphonaceae bacterium]